LARRSGVAGATVAPYRWPMQPDLTRVDDRERDVDGWWLPPLSALEAGLARLHQELAVVDRELRQTRADYRRLLELNQAWVSHRLPQAGLEQLTQQERRVATLAAQGHSNLAVAAQLHVSVHTVKSQMGGILRKLDLRSRWELEHVLRSRRESFEE
jgi:DNA-binding NarL/FixJ family response regulator